MFVLLCLPAASCGSVAVCCVCLRAPFAPARPRPPLSRPCPPEPDTLQRVLACAAALCSALSHHTHAHARTHTHTHTGRASGDDPRLKKLAKKMEGESKEAIDTASAALKEESRQQHSSAGSCPTPTTPTHAPLASHCCASATPQGRGGSGVCVARFCLRWSLTHIHTHARTHTRSQRAGQATRSPLSTGIIVRFASPDGAFSSDDIPMPGTYSENGSGSFKSNAAYKIGGIKQGVTLSLWKGVWPGMTGIPTAGNPIKLRIYTSVAGTERQMGDVICTLVGTLASGDGRKIGAPSAAGGGGGK